MQAEWNTGLKLWMADIGKILNLQGAYVISTKWHLLSLELNLSFAL